MTIKKTYPYILMIGSIVGLLASFFLTLDTIKLIENPTTDLPCNLNPFVSCTSAATSWQGEVFGFPNSILGMIAFSMLFAVGVMLFSGGRAKKPLWLLVNFGTLAAMIFVVWFFYQSVFNIRSLCLYCMIVWIVTWPIFLYTTVWNVQEDHISLHKKNDEFLLNHHGKILAGVYLLAVLLIFIKFKDFFLY